MIQVIGLMIGLYILARCAEMFDNEKTGVIARILATIAFLGNCIGILLLLTSGAGTTVLPR